MKLSTRMHAGEAEPCASTDLLSRQADDAASAEEGLQIGRGSFALPWSNHKPMLERVPWSALGHKDRCRKGGASEEALHACLRSFEARSSVPATS